MTSHPPQTRRDPELRWQLLDALTEARDDWGLKDRTLAVLRALLGFLPRGERVNLTVFPSNKTLSQRLFGMPESTLRRHIARLIDCGLIARRSSPNGKRYRIGQQADLTFGLDLSGVFAQAATLRQQVEDARARRIEIAALRQRIRLCLPELNPEDRTRVQKALRRVLTPTALGRLLAQIREVLTLKPDVSAAQNDCHLQTESNPNTDQIIAEAVTDLEDMARKPIRNAQDMQDVGAWCAQSLTVASAWTFARQRYGPLWATLALAYILPRHERLKHPDRYLHSLVRRAGQGGFDLLEALHRDRRRQTHVRP